MRKFCCICLALLLFLGTCGCQNKDTGIDVLPSLTEEEFERIENKHPYEDAIYGKIIAKMEPNVLVLDLYQYPMIQKWGEVVYVITDSADRWCIDDEIHVIFSVAEQPYDTNKHTRIIADEVHVLILGGKPIIYLYPEVPTVCSVKVTLKGQFTSTYPEHGTNGWQNFTAYPDGTLVFPDGKEYYALFWEGYLPEAQFDFSQGWCVPGKDTAAFLEWALAQQGLTPREANEFIVYWLPLMQENPYNVISFQTTAYTDSAALSISPAPDSLLRVFMAYYPTDIAVDIQPQTFEPFIRQGFTVVEWGASQVKEP